MLLPSLARVQAACLALVVVSLMLSFNHISQYPLVEISREYLGLSKGPAVVGSKLLCQPPQAQRYQHLREKQYFFALDLYNSINVLPSLMGAVGEAVQFLGPENCTISIVEGRSTDGTREVLLGLQTKMEALGATYVLQTSELNPLDGGDRVKMLAELRNLALEPMTKHTAAFAKDTTVLFLNDISLCAEDILELAHQRVVQDAHMTCAMDWTWNKPDDAYPAFYDVWVARGMNGDSFFDIPGNGSWHKALNLFWNNPAARRNYQARNPFQVFSCWNGITAFVAEPLLEHKVKFRGPYKEECYQGEPQLFCKDLWVKGYNRIAVVPTVNVEYSDEAAAKVKDLKGRVSDFLQRRQQRIKWKAEPPASVRCMPSYTEQLWVPWDESIHMA